MSLLPLSFYTRPDVVQIARDLLGKHLYTNIGGTITSGMICETEAYAGITDKASHAYGGRRTNRTETMYARGGIAYVYLCYGIHSLFNVVTNLPGIPHAVLIRAIIPADGIDYMLKRTEKEKVTKNFGTGPGKVSKLLGIHFRHSGLDLKGKNLSIPPAIWIEDSGFNVSAEMISAGPRVGVGYAGQDALLPYRFKLVSVSETTSDL
jgi:DNA-3-methyladenine glycosylase